MVKLISAGKTGESRMATGEIEVFVEDYQILNKSIELPISINSSGLEINEELAFTVSLFRLKTSAFTK